MVIQAKPVPLWVSIIIVATCTVAAFWVFGGQNYFAHQAEIEKSLFTHEDEARDPLRWIFWLMKTGTSAALMAFVFSTVTLTIWNRRARKVQG